MYMNVLIDLISREVSGAFEKAGFDPAFGARPLKRLIVHTVETVVSNKIVRGEIQRGDNIEVVFQNGNIDVVKK